MNTKGWPCFRSVALELQGDERFDFYVFGDCAGDADLPDSIDSVPWAL